MTREIGIELFNTTEREENYNEIINTIQKSN